MSHRVRLALLGLAAVMMASVAIAAGPSYRIGVDGLACPFCAYGIEKQLRRIEEVETIETQIKEGRVVVTLGEGATLDREAAEQALQEAGFALRSFERVPQE